MKPIRNRSQRLYYQFWELPIGQEFVAKSDVCLGIVRTYIKQTPASYTGIGGREIVQKFKRSAQNPPTKIGFPHPNALCVLPENVPTAIKFEERRLDWSNWRKQPEIED